jgi:hypothetical protein
MLSAFRWIHSSCRAKRDAASGTLRIALSRSFATKPNDFSHVVYEERHDSLRAKQRADSVCRSHAYLEWSPVSGGST